MWPSRIGRSPRSLADAQGHVLRFIDDDLHGREGRALVRAVAKRLRPDSPQAHHQCSPVSESYPERPAACDLGFCHLANGRAGRAAFRSLPSLFSFTDSLGLLLDVRLFWSLLAIAHLVGSWLVFDPVAGLRGPDQVFRLSVVAATRSPVASNGEPLLYCMVTDNHSAWQPAKVRSARLAQPWHGINPQRGEFVSGPAIPSSSELSYNSRGGLTVAESRGKGGHERPGENH